MSGSIETQPQLEGLLKRQEEQSRQLQQLLDLQQKQHTQIEELTTMLGSRELGLPPQLSGVPPQLSGVPPQLGPLQQTQPREDAVTNRVVPQLKMGSASPDFDSHETTKPLVFSELNAVAFGMDALNVGLGALESTFSILTGRPRPPARERAHREPSKPMRGLNAEGTVVMVADVLFVIASSLICVLAVTLLNPVNRKEELDEAELVWLWHIQFLSLMWVGLRFFVRRRLGKWTIVDNLSDIRAVYLRSWFAFDMIYSFPLELFFLHGYGSSAGLYFSLPRHFLRFLRFTSLISSVNPLTAFRQWFRFIAYLSVMMFIAHCYASMFLYLAKTYEDPEITKDLTYLDSLYWCTASLTSVGYGDVPTTSPQNRALSVVVMTSGVAMIATFTAFATAFLTFKDSLTLEQDARKNHMASMLHYYKIPWDVQRQVIQVFPSIIDNETERQFREAVEGMPQFIREKLMLYFNAHHLKQVSLFSDVAEKNPEILLEVTKTMVQHIYAPNEYIVREGDEGHEMFIILTGTVEVFKSTEEGVNATVFATLSRGDWFGEQAVLREGSVCAADVATVTTTEVLVLAKAPMMKVLEKCPDILEKIIKVSERRRQRSERSEKSGRKGSDGDFGQAVTPRSVVVCASDFPRIFPEIAPPSPPSPAAEELTPVDRPPPTTL